MPLTTPELIFLDNLALELRLGQSGPAVNALAEKGISLTQIHPLLSLRQTYRGETPLNYVNRGVNVVCPWSDFHDIQMTIRRNQH
jgi:hypothetical protein